MHHSLKKIILIAVSVIMAAALFLLLFGIFRIISTEEGRALFRDRINGLGFAGCLLLIALTVSQVFLFIFPGEPVELLAGMCYGTFGGLIVIYAGVLISTLIIFLLVRGFGRKAALKLLGREKTERIEGSRLLRSKKAELLLLLLFIIPGTPKDLLVYIGAMTQVKAERFVLLSTLLRFPGIITSTVVGDRFTEGDARFAITVYAVTLAVSLLLLLLIRRHDDIREIIDIDREGQDG